MLLSSAQQHVRLCLKFEMMLQVLKAVFAGLFTAGLGGVCDQQVLVKTTGEQH